MQQADTTTGSDTAQAKITCFKAYDIRGRIPDELNVDVAYRVANAMAEFLDAKKIVIGRDIRQSSAELADAVARGLVDAGVEVLDFGLGGTEMVYFATPYLDADGGIMVTASHNPADYNGLKLVREPEDELGLDPGFSGRFLGPAAGQHQPAESDEDGEASAVEPVSRCGLHRSHGSR